MNIVPIAISYEYDPTDSLKIPELLANLKNEKYIKSENEDFNTIMNGLMGQKKHIHIHAGDLMNDELENLREIDNNNHQIKALAQMIDAHILSNYKLWPSNYIACDLLSKTAKYADFYSENEKADFIKRMEEKIDKECVQTVESFLAMYANPVINQMQVLNSLIES